MGRHAGWMAASSALARVSNDDAPHNILLPEVTINDKKFLLSDLDDKSKSLINDLTRTVMEYKELLRSYNQSLTLTNTYASGLKTEVEKTGLPESSNEDSPSITIADKKYDGSDLPDTVKAYVSE